MPKVPKRTKSSPVTTAGSEVNAAAKRVAAQRKVTSPVWEGPSGPGPNGGITQSMLGRYLVCPERFRAQYVDGWHPADKFNARIEYGSLWHECEKAAASEVRHFKGELKGTDTTAWSDSLVEYAESLAKRYQRDREEIGLWYAKCHALFPRYVEYWRTHPDQIAREPLLQEHVFDVPYKLPSGRTVRLRGKWDSVDLIREGENAGVWLQENKTKSTVDAVKIGRQVKFDLQTMMYLVALQTSDGLSRERFKNDIEFKHVKAVGVRYNVVRRAAHKSVESMLKKLDEDVRNRRAGEWFCRFNVAVRPADMVKFQRTCLDPLLDNLFDDYEWWLHCSKSAGLSNAVNSTSPSISPYDYQTRCKWWPAHRRRHYMMPYGIYSPLTEGGSADLDEYVHTGSTAGLRRVTTLFEELQ